MADILPETDPRIAAAPVTFEGGAGYLVRPGAAGKTDAIHIYDWANHAFNNDTNAARCDKAAANLAWGRTIAFLKTSLS